LAVSADGMTVWAFGDGDYGKLGLGNSTAKSSPQVPLLTLLFMIQHPHKNTQLSILHVINSCFFTKLSVCLLFFQKVDVLCGIGIKKVACGTQFSVALTKDGNVYTFGQGKPCADMDAYLSQFYKLSKHPIH